MTHSIWPTTLKAARQHRYAVWEKSKSYPYDEGYCPVAVRVLRALALLASGRWGGPRSPRGAAG